MRRTLIAIALLGVSAPAGAQTRTRGADALPLGPHDAVVVTVGRERRIQGAESVDRHTSRARLHG